MKKVILLICALLLTTSLFGQDDWDRLDEIESYLALWEIEVEVWYNPNTQVLNFEDRFSRDFDDMLFWRNKLMVAFEFMLSDIGQTFEDFDIEAMIYSLFIVASKDESRYDFYMEREWCIRYFNSSRNDRQYLLDVLDEAHYKKWFSRTY